MQKTACIISVLVFFCFFIETPRVSAQELARFWGVYLKGFPGLPRDFGLLNSFSSLVGSKPTVVMYFTDWQHDGFTTDVEKYLGSQGVTGMITWMPSGEDVSKYSNDAVINGNFDSFINTYAQQAKIFGKPILLRFAHEMNGNWYPWSSNHSINSSNTASKYVLMWRHVHDIFTKNGATNVQWVWCPSIEVGSSTPTRFEDMYPGDKYVDWLCLDGYNIAGQDNLPWKSLYDSFYPSYVRIIALSQKPLLIGQTATGEIGGNKEEWIKESFLSDIPNRLPKIRGVIWFNEQKEQNWPVNSSETALSAFRTVAAQQQWQGSLLPYFPAHLTMTPTPGITLHPLPTFTVVPTKIVPVKNVSTQSATLPLAITSPDAVSTSPSLSSENVPVTPVYWQYLPVGVQNVLELLYSWGFILHDSPNIGSN
jgi:hypothetical protein